MGKFYLILTLLLTGCESQVDRAKARATMIDQDGSPEEKCRAEKAVADAYLNANDAAGYRTAHLSADITCRNAELERNL